MPQFTDDQDNDKPRAEGSYEVGYGKPPKTTRWQKGQSGNPSGKKKGADAPPDTATLLQDLLEEKVTIQVGGRAKRMSRQEGLLRNLLNKAFTSERAFGQLVKLATDLKIAVAKDTNLGGLLVVPAQLFLDDWSLVAGRNQEKYRHPSSHPDEFGHPDLSGPWDGLPTKADKIRSEEAKASGGGWAPR